MSIVCISDTCFQISMLSLIKSVQSTEKVWEERKRSRRGNCKWENYWPHSQSSGHHRQNPGTPPPGPEAFWHTEVTVGRRWRHCTDCSLWYKEVENSLWVKDHVTVSHPRIITKSNGPVATARHIHLPVVLTRSEWLSSPGKKILRSWWSVVDPRKIRTSLNASQIFKHRDMTSDSFIIQCNAHCRKKEVTLATSVINSWWTWAL